MSAGSTVTAPQAAPGLASDGTLDRLPERLPVVALALAMAAAAALILYLTRGFTFYYDEWGFLMNRQDFTADALLSPHNEHNVAVTVLLFKGLWELAGLDHYVAFRVLVVAAHLLCVGLLYVYARRRVGPLAALAPAVIILFLGTAWEIVLWPFEVQFLLPIAAGLGALLLLERQDLRGDLGAGTLMVLALASGSLGIPLLAGVAVELLFRRERLVRLARVVAAPAALYVLWLQEYDPFRTKYVGYETVPDFVLDQLGSAIAALAGFRFDSLRTPALVAAVLLLALLAERFVRGRVDRGRLAAIVTIALVYWGALALYRPWVAEQEASRFLYGGAVFVLLALVEVARGWRPGPRALAILGAVTALCAASNVDDMRSGAHNLRAYTDYVSAGLGALELTRGHVHADFQPEPTRAPDIVAGRYFRAVDRWGSPADTTAEIVSAGVGPRAAADIVLVEALRLNLREAPLPARPGPLPEVTRPPLGSVAVVRGCLRFTPRELASLDVQLPPGGVALAAGKEPVVVQLRRFADVFPADNSAPEQDLFGIGRQAFGRGSLRARNLQLSSDRSAALRIPADGAGIPWRARFSSEGRFTVCGLPQA
jgi:hypothetical protein